MRGTSPISGKALRVSLRVSLIAASLLALATCNLFKTGLGPKVDVTPPELAITSPVQGAYLRGTVVLTGTATDDIGVSSLVVAYPTTGGGTIQKSITVSANGWTISLPSGGSGGLAEGKDTITVTAKAASGKAATASVFAYVDNTPPTVLVTTPTTYGSSPPIYSGYVDLSGEAYDASPVTSVSATLSYFSGGTTKTITQTANGTNSWSSRFFLSTASGGPLGSTLDGTVLSYSVVATDAAGNASAYYYHSQDIYGLLGTGKLFPTIQELGQLDQGGTSPSQPTGIVFSALSAVRIADTAVSRGDLKFTYYFTPTIQYANLDPANPSANILAPGSVIVGNIIPPSNAGAVDPASLVFKIFTLADFQSSPQGAPQVSLTAANPLGVQLVLTNLGTSQSFRVALENSGGVNLTPGQYVIDVTAAAQGSGTAHDDVSFGIDTSAPTLTETSVGNTLATYDKPFVLSGIAGSLSGLATLTVDESADGGVTWTTVYGKTYSGNPTSDSWSTSPSVSLPKAGADGSYGYRITLTTSTGLKTIVYRSVIYDQTPPTLTVTAPTPGAWVSSSSLSLAGVAGDGSGSGVSSVYYLADDASVDHSADIASWVSSASTGAPTSSSSASWSQAGGIVSNWNGSATLSSEGYKRLWVVAVDKAGNHDSLSLLPATAMTAGTTYTIDTIGSTDFTKAGAASDTVGLSFTASGPGTGSGLVWTGGGQIVPFGYDLNPPTLAETHAASSGFTAATAASFAGFSGTVADSDALAGLSAQYSKNGVPQAGAPITPAGTSWAWSPFGPAIDVTGHTDDGSYSFIFTATDIAGKTTTLARTMTIDTQAPTVSVTSPSSGGWVSTASLSVTGVATDGTGSGVAAVYVKADALYAAGTPTDHSAEDPTVSANGWTLASGQTSWSAALSLSGEGRKTLWVKAVDAVGNQTTAAAALSSRVDFGLDLNPPTLGFTDAVGALVSAGFTLAGTTGDTNPAGPPSLAVTVDGGSAQAVTVSSGAWSYAVSVDTAGHGNDGSHSYVFTSTDVSGKTTTLSRSVTIDTTPPTTAIGQPGNYTAAQAQYWLSGATASLGGSAADAGTGASGVAKVYYKVDSLGTSHATDGAATISGTWTLAAGTGTWSATADLGTLGEGQFTLWVAAYDNAGNLSAISSRDFGVDQAPPNLTETSHPASSYTKSAFALGGDVGDTDALASLSITESKNGGAAVAVGLTSVPASLGGAKSATYTSASLPLGGVADGSYAYALTAKDVAGKTTTVNRTVNIDTTPPTVSLTAMPAWVSSSAYTITGTGGDPNGGASGVASVQYKLDGGAWTNAVWTDSSGGGNTAGSWSATLSGLAEGQHSLEVQAADAAGNVTTLSTTNFGVDLNPPNLAVAAAPATITAATAASFTGFSGSLYDTNPAGLASLTLSSTQNGNPVATDAAISYPGTSTTNGNPWSYAFAVDGSDHGTDGLWSFTFTATDVSGKTATVTKTIMIDTTAPTTTVTSPGSGGWVSTASLSVTGVATDGTGSGVAAVYVKADALYAAGTPTDHSAEDPTVSANGWTLASGQTSWSAALSLSGEGRKTLWVKAVDAVGNQTTAAAALSSRVDFGLDLNPPTLGFTDAVGALVSAGFTLAGTTGDTNPAGPPSLAVTVDGGSAQAVTVSSGAWSYAVSVDTAGHGNDGSHSYVFTSTDVSGKTTTLSRSVTIDTTPPTTAIGQPGNYTAAQAQYWLSGATASLGGSAADAGTGASGVAKVYYKVDSLGTSHATDGAATISGTWTLAAGTGTWSATADLGTLGEGQFTLWVAAYDNAGNLSAISSRDFGVDQAPPNLTETSHPASSYTKSAFALGGDVGDTDALASLSITESKNGGAAVAVGLTSVPASLGGAKSATYTSASLPLGGVADGSYAYALTAKDVAGKTTTVNRTVNIDTTPPTVSLTAMPAWVSSSAYTITGTGGDPNGGASGVASVQYKLDGGAWTNAVWTDSSGGGNTAGSWSATLSGLAEGQHSLEVQAADAAGNTTTLAAAAFGVDINPPNLSETTLGTTSQVTKTGAFTMSGTIGDTDPASVPGSTLTVSVSVNGGAAANAAIVGSTWSYAQAKVDGSYSYVITATDASGKTTSINRLVLLDSTPPTLTVSAPAPGAWTSSTGLSIGGTALDGAGSGVKNIYYLVDAAANDHSSDIAAWNLTDGAAAPVSGSSAAWTAASGLPSSWSGSSTLSAEGAQALWVVAADKAGNTSTLAKVAAGSFAAGAVYTIASIGTTDFTALGASSNTVGLSFTATGPGSGSGSAWTGTGIAVPFGLDLNPPALSETGVDTSATVLRNASIGFSGSASDTDALAAAHALTVTVDGGAVADLAFTTAPNWSYTYAVDGATHAQDGTHSFVFTATDIAGKKTTVTRTILVDTTPATVAVSSPVNAVWTGASPYTVSGTASDGTGAGVSQVWTIVDSAATSHAADTTTAISTGGAWKEASGTTSWSASWALAPEGTKTLWVAVLDAAGNWSTSYAAVNFGYDVTPPALGISPMGGYRSAFSVAGTVSDGASGVASLQYKVDTGSFSPVTVAPGWSVSISAAVFSALTEGLHTVTVQATDNAGNQTTQAATFNKDTTPPTLSYSNISSGGGTVVQDSSPVLSGTLADVSGVASATYTLQSWNNSTQTWNTIASGADLGSPAGATSWSWSLDLSAAGLDLPDGKYQIAIGAADTPGNAIASPVAVPFLLSRTNPGATIAAPSLGTFQNAAFPLVGTASDPNGVTLVRAKIASGSVDFSSGSTNALPALSVTAATGTPGVFTTSSPHGLNVGDQVYLWGTPMPVAPTGSLQSGTVYYVQSVPTSTSFTIAATSGGAALAINTSAAANLIVGIAKDSFSTFHPSIPVTVSGSTMTAPNHGLADGDLVYFQGTSLPSPTSAAAAYYVVNATAATFQVSMTSGGAALALTSTGASVAVYSPTHAVNWMIPAMSVAGLGDGPLTAYIQAAAGSGKLGQTSRDFTLDTTAPTIAVSSPGSGTRSVGNLTITGTSTDPGSIPSGVTGTIQYQIGNGYNLSNPASWTSANVTGGAYSWSIGLGDMSSYANATYATQCDASGNPAAGTNLWKLPIVFQALDKAGNAGQLTSYFLILDPNGNIPVVTVTQPSTGLTFGGQQRITGTATQPVAIYGVEVAVDPAGGSNFPAAPVAVSIAGSTLSASANPFTDGMMVFLSGTAAPQIGGASVSPTSAYWVINAGATSFQLAAASGGTTPVAFSSAGSGVTASVWAPATLTSTGNNVTWYYDINATGAYPQNGATSQQVTVQARAWNSPTLGGSKGTISGTLTAPLVMTFNASFPQIKNIIVDGQSYYSQITTKGTIALSATLSSSKGIAKVESVEGSPLSGSTTLYDTASDFGATASHNASYWSATVTPPAAMTGDSFSAGHLPKLLIAAKGSAADAAQFLAAGAPSSAAGTVFTPTAGTSLALASGSFFEADASGDFDYALSMTIDSAQLYSNTSGQYVFNIRVTDMTSPVPEVSSQPITLNEDNFYPTSYPAAAGFVNPAATAAGSFLVGTRYMIVSAGTTDFTAVGAASSTPGLVFVATGSGSGSGTAVPVLTGTSFKIQGSSTDTGTGSGPISGLNKIVVYLSNAAGTQILDIKNGGGASIAASSLSAMDMAGGGSVGAVPYPDTSAYSNYFASIDTLGSTSTNGFPDSYVIDGNARDWWVQLDTTKLADGPVTVHYVIWDQAGNATHYAQSTFVSNHAPSLSNVVLGTDLTGAGSINATQTYSSDYAATGFTGRNKLLALTIDSVYDGSNGSLSYSLIYAGHDYLNPAGQAGVTVSGVTAGSETVTLNCASISPSIPDTTTSNGATFTFTATDQTPGSNQSYSQSVSLNIHNNDTTPPTISVAPLGKAYSTPVDPANGGVFTDAGKTLGPVSSYGANIGAAGGHVEYASPITAGASALSGQVVIKGKAWDDASLQKITAAIPGFDGGSGVGAEFTIASYSGGSLSGLSGTGWSFAVDAGSQSLSLADGQVLNWSFTWDSSLVATVAATNVTITFKDYNNGSPSLSGSSSMLVDIVPYVTAVSTALSNAYSSNPSVFNRSALGYYPVSNTGTLTLTGYNLYLAGSTTVTMNGSSAYLATSAPSKTSLTETLSAGASSGPLNLTVSGVQAGNNINANNASMTTSGGSTVFYDQVPNGVNNPLLTDDLDFKVWSFATVASSTTQAFRYPSMRVSGSGKVGFAYDYGAQEVHVNDNGTDTKVDGSFTQWYDTAFAYDGSGRYYAIGVNGDSGGTGNGSYNQTANTGFYAWQAGSATADGSGGTYTRGTYKALIESAWNGTAFNSDRVQYPKIAATGIASPYSIYMTYYDASQNQLTFRYGTVATGGVFGGAIANQPNSGVGSAANAQAMATSASTYGVGLYSAIGVTSTGVAVAAWYDQANQRLVFSYNTNPASTTSAGQWQANASVVDSSFAGWYVDMAVDAADGIHIAYYNSSSGDLKYAYLSSYAAAPQVTTVDSFLSTGTDVSIAVYYDGTNYVPYISYFMPTFSQTSFSIRTAWRTNFASLQSGVANDQYTGNWEVMTVPTAGYPQDFRVGIGIKANAGGANSPILGYSTKNGATYALETAQLQ